MLSLMIWLFREVCRGGIRAMLEMTLQMVTIVTPSPVRLLVDSPDRIGAV